MDFHLIDNEEGPLSMLAKVKKLRNEPAPFYIDCEGHKLGRSGTLDLMQLHVLRLAQTFVVDLFTLRHKAFCASL